MNREQPPHDTGYKSFFSNPEMVESLLRDFVPEEFVTELDFTTLERCSGSYVTDDLRERHDDVVWRVRWKRGSWCYALIIMEFQSTPDYWMALRIASYTALLLLDLVKSKEIRGREGLPPVFPIVLYRGEKRWSGPQELRKLFASMPKSLLPYCPEARCFLLDEGHLPEETLEQSEGLAAQLVKLERARTLEEVRPIVKILKKRLRDPAYIALRRTFQVWLGREVFKRSGMTDEIPEFRDLDEVDAMLEERAAQWKDEYIRQGLALGEASGELKRGRAVLLALLRDRFGALPQEVESAVHVLDDADQLMELTLAVYRSNSLESFFSRLHAAFGNQRQ